VWEDVGCIGPTTLALYPNDVTTEEAKQLGSVGVVTRRNKNDLMRHLTPRMMCPLHHGIRQSYLKWVPRLPFGLPKLRVQRLNPLSLVRAA
jgi:hypothetical protein